MVKSVCPVLAEDWSSAPSTHMRQFTDPVTSASGKASASGLHRHPHSCAHTYIFTHNEEFLKKNSWVVVAHTFNLNTWEAGVNEAL